MKTKRKRSDGSRSLAMKSKSTRMRERERRCDALFWERSCSAPEITDILLEEGLFDADGSAKAARQWVVERVRKLRENADPLQIIALQRPVETERYRRQLQKALRASLEIIEDNESITVERVTPSGDVKTVKVPRRSTADKNRAIKIFAEIAEKLALVNSVNVTGAIETGNPDQPDTGMAPTEERAGSFSFNFSGRSVDALIGERTGKGPVN